jgi:hypothetical protein
MTEWATDERSTPEPTTIVKAYTRLYSDADGHSRFEDVELPAKTGGVIESDLVATLADPIAAETVVFRNVLREASDSEPHNAPRRQFIIQITGWCEIETSTGEVRRFGPGEVLLVEDLDGRGHITRADESGERRTLLITLRTE